MKSHSGVKSTRVNAVRIGFAMFLVCAVGLTNIANAIGDNEYIWNGTTYSSLGAAEAAMRASGDAEAYLELSWTTTSYNSVNNTFTKNRYYKVRPQPATIVDNHYLVPFYGACGMGSPGSCSTEDDAYSTFVALLNANPACPDIETVQQGVLHPDDCGISPRFSYTYEEYGICGPAGNMTSLGQPNNTNKWIRLKKNFLATKTQECGGDTFNPILERIAEFNCPAGLNARSEQRYFPDRTCQSDIIEFIEEKPKQFACAANDGNPCHANTGNKSQVETDFRSGELKMVRYYNSRREFDAHGDVSPGWNHSYADHVLHYDSGDDDLFYVNENGKLEHFEKQSNGTYHSRQRGNVLFEEITGGLKRISGGRSVREYTHEHADRDYLLPTSLYSLSNPDQVTTIAYDSDDRIDTVTDASGRSLQFNYTGYKLTSVGLPDGETISYTYDANIIENLVQVTYQDGSSKTYHYEDSNDPHLLTGITDETGTRFATYGYDSNGRAILSKHALDAGKVELRYTAAGEAEVDTANGDTKTYYFDTTAPYRVNQVDTSDGVTNYSTYYTYNVDGWLEEKTNPRGYTTKYAYDDYRKDWIKEAFGETEERQTDYQWDTTENELDWVQVGNQKTSYTYNAAGQQLTRTVTDTTTMASRTWTRTYYTTGVLAGLLHTVDGPRTGVTDVTTYEYYDHDAGDGSYHKRDLKKVTNALGHTTEYLAYDGAGRPLQVEDANGVVTTMTYYPRGWLNTRTTGGQTVTYTYTAFGAVDVVTQDDGSYMDYDYDAAQRLVKVTDGKGSYIEYTLDMAGNQTVEEIRNGNDALRKKLSREFDDLGRLKKLINADGISETVFTYDANGNSDTVVDPVNSDTDQDHSYDALDRLIDTVDAVNAQIQYQYDERDNLTQVTDDRGLTTVYTYNGLDDLTQLDSPDTGVTTYSYNAGGNRTSQTDARNVVTNYSYDALNRITDITYPGTTGLNVSFKYDQVRNLCSDPAEQYATGRLDKINDASGQTIYCYDQYGNITKKRQNVKVGGADSKFKVVYSYDDVNRIEQITYPDHSNGLNAGTVVTYTRNSATGQIEGVDVTPAGQTTVNLITDIAYYAMGPKKKIWWANGKRIRHIYDENYWPQTVSSNNTDSVDYSYTTDAVGNITGIVDQNSTDDYDFGYNAAYRLDKVDINSATDLAFTYDGLGNRLSETESGSTDTYTYDTSSNRLVTTQIPALGDNYVYDAAGNVLRTEGLSTGSSYEFTISNANRMASATHVSNRSAPSGEYHYNGKGQRVLKIVDTTGVGVEYHFFVYNEAGQLIQFSSPNLTQDYIWVDNTPVGIVQNGVVYAIEVDHLDTPRAVIDLATDEAIWKWDSLARPFGDVSPNEDPDNNSTTFTLNLRFPGQWYDAEKDSNYNYYRDYDAKIGRYLQSDPIGLGGGVNTYGYALQNSLRYFDPEGLNVLGVCIGTSLSDGPAPFGEALCACYAAYRAVNLAINFFSGAQSEQCNNNESNNSEECEDDPCGPDSRVQAMRKAQAWSQVPKRTRTPIDLTDVRGSSRGENFNRLRASGASHGGYYNNLNPANRIEDHPDGHPHLTGSGQPDHHDCPHIHAYRADGSERIFTYRRLY